MSSLTIVTWPVPSAIVSPLGAESTTWNVSFGSTAVSPSTVTVICAFVVPAANVTVPEAAV